MSSVTGMSVEVVDFSDLSLEGAPDRDRFERFCHLAETSIASYATCGSPDSLDEGICLYRKAITAFPQTGGGLSDALFALAHALAERYHNQWSRDDLQERVTVLRQSLELRPLGHQDHVNTLIDLADALNDRYALSAKEEDLKERIDLCTQSLELCPPEHLLYKISLTHLGNALNDRYDLFGEAEDLDRRIDLFTQALRLHPLGHPDRDTYLNSLAVALGARYARFGGADDLEKRIEICTEVLELRPHGHPNRDVILNNLAIALADRYACFGEEDDLNMRVEYALEALELCPPESPRRDTLLNNLANAFGARHAHHGNADDLDRYIDLCTQALELRPPGHRFRASSLNNLASALGARYSRYGEDADLRKRIDLCTESLELRPTGHPQRSSSLNNLALALSAYYSRYKDDDVLEKRVDICMQSLELHPPGHPHRDFALIRFGMALGDRYVRYCEEDDLSRSIDLYMESLELRPPGHPHRNASLNNVATALSSRYALHGRENDLKEWMDLSTQSLELCPPGRPNRETSIYNLVNALGARYVRYGGEEDLRKAFAILESEVDDASSTEGGMLQCALHWVDFAEDAGHASVGNAFTKAIGCLRRYLSIGPTVRLQYQAILRQTGLSSLAVDAAAHFIEEGDVELAVELLDEGRSLLWSEMRRLRDTLSPFHEDLICEPLRTRYHLICEEIRDLSNAEIRFGNDSGHTSTIAYDEVLKKKREKTKEYNVLLDEIRRIPGCGDFQHRRRFVELKVAAEEGPVIVVNCSERRSDAIIVFADRNPLLVSLEANFRSEMIKAHEKYLEGLAKMKGSIDPTLAIFDFSFVLKDVTAALWDGVVHLMVEKLEEAGVAKGSRIWWCPTSVLTSLPLHAAGKRSDFLLDHFVPSYTPTLSALIDARRTVSVSKPPSPRILLVAQTKALGLNTAGEEVRRVTRLGSLVQVLDEQDANPDSVIASLPLHNWVHFVCHGIVSENPFESSLVLYNRSQLRLNDIIKAHLPDAQFAFLAACHTAELNRGKVLQDEVLHLAGAMQFSGFRSVVGTMWQMVDKDGPRLAEVFYQEMLAEDGGAGEKHTRAAGALWKAMQMMRKKIPIARWANFVHIGA